MQTRSTVDDYKAIKPSVKEPATKQFEIHVYNSSKQSIPIQLRIPGSDFFNEHQIDILPGSVVRVPKNCINVNQINNLKAKRMIRVVFDSELDG